MENLNTLIAIAIVLAAVEIAAGIAIGWWLKGNRSSDDPQSAEETQRARTALAHLHELASTVAADVGDHATRMKAISGTLQESSPEGQDADAKVLTAMADIVKANEHLQQQLEAAKTRLDEQAAKIEEHVAVAKTDSLTGIANRRAFDEQLIGRLNEWHRKQTPLSLLMIDVDKFKSFNDTYGHQAGDEVLRRVAQALHTTMREMDVVARYGGEEFAVIVPSSKLHEALPGAERARLAIEKLTIPFEGKELKVTASFGAAQALVNEDLASLIRRADEALYASKKSGRNRTSYHDGRTILPVAETPKPAAEAKPAAPPAAEATDASGSRIDEVTGLPNRTAFCEDVRRRLAESHRYGLKLSLMMLKVDQFPSIVERFGQPVGDLVLRTTTKFLMAAMRDMDMVTYYDPHTFGLLLPGTTTENAATIAERLRQAIDRCPLRAKDFELRFTVSLGIAGSVNSDDSTSLLRRAEAACDASTLAGGDCTNLHDGRDCQRVTLDELPQSAAT